MAELEPSLEGTLFMLVACTKAERDAGAPGWVQPPEQYLGFCKELVSEGLAEENADDEGWFRSTAAGDAQVALELVH